MKSKLLKTAILRATVTAADLDYIGSITIDEDLLEKANLSVGEKVLVVDHNNGSRLDTYTILGQRGSGVICMNGAAAHLIKKNDQITIMSFTWADREIAPHIVVVDKDNKFVRFQEE